MRRNDLFRSGISSVLVEMGFMGKSDQYMMTSYMSPRARWGCERERERAPVTANQYARGEMNCVIPAAASVINRQFQNNRVDERGLRPFETAIVDREIYVVRPFLDARDRTFLCVTLVDRTHIVPTFWMSLAARIA